MTEPKTVIGLTGNIACGKSKVARILAELGAEVIDADIVAHEIMEPGGNVLTDIQERFGESVINPDGALNRAALGAIVFSDPVALEALEQITHPPVVDEILRRVQSATARVVVIDAIKLFESGLADHCQETWTVYCDPEVQRNRLMNRNGYDREEAERRIGAQPPQEEKIKQSTRVIDNSRTVEDTRRQVETAWKSLATA